MFKNNTLIILMTIMILVVGCSAENKKDVKVKFPSKDIDISDEKKEVNEEDQENEGKDCKAVGYTYNEDELVYELVWSDEFEYEGLPDDTKWSYDVGGHGWGNNELQYYTEGENVTVKDGLLVIEARKEEYKGMDYTSTRLISKNKGDWKYGKIEVRAKLPSGTGTWPAIWMLPTDWEYGGWPASGEIDIMEHVGYNMHNIVGTVHTEAYNHMINTQKGKTLRISNVDTEFHTYGIEWLPDKIKFFIDGQQYFQFKPSNINDCPTYKEWPFDQRFHLLLNIAVGGNWGGQRGVDDSIFPQTMEIDYVRVYQSEEISEIDE